MKDGSFGADAVFPQGVPLPFKGEQIHTQYYPQLIAIEDRVAVAGGANFSVRAAGLTLDGTYECLVSLPSGDETVPAIVLATTELVCLAPAWPREAAAGEVGVQVWDTRNSICLSCLGDALALHYVPHWEGFQNCNASGPFSCSESEGPALGDFELNISGFGLDSAAEYRVRFADGEKEFLLQVEFQGGWPLLRVPLEEAWPFAAATTNVTLYRLLDGEWDTVPLGGASAATVVSFEFLPSLGEREGTAPLPLEGCAGECWPAVITIKGEGLNPAEPFEIVHFGGQHIRNFTEMECLLTLGEETLVSTVVTVDSQYQLRCFVGNFRQAPKYTRGSDFQVSVSRRGRPIDWLQGSASVTLREAWTDSSCSRSVCKFSSAEGDTVDVVGFGFDVDAEYECRFGDVVAARTEVVSDRLLQCVTPEWTLPATEVELTLHSSTDGGCSSGF